MRLPPCSWMGFGLLTSLPGRLCCCLFKDPCRCRLAACLQSLSLSPSLCAALCVLALPCPSSLHQTAGTWERPNLRKNKPLAVLRATTAAIQWWARLCAWYDSVPNEASSYHENVLITYLTTWSGARTALLLLFLTSRCLGQRNVECVHTGWGVEGVNMSVVVDGLVADRQAEHRADLTIDQYVLSNGICSWCGSFFHEEKTTDWKQPIAEQKIMVYKRSLHA